LDVNRDECVGCPKDPSLHLHSKTSPLICTTTTTEQPHLPKPINHLSVASQASDHNSLPPTLSCFTRNPSPSQQWQKSKAMAPNKYTSHSTSNRNGEAVGRQANILASCYIVDFSARLTGFHYSTTGAGGMFFPCPS